MKSIKVCEYSRSRSFHYDLILQDQASGERSQDQWSSGYLLLLQLVLSRGGPKMSPRTSSIVLVIFSFRSFEISEYILRTQKLIIGQDSFSNQRLIHYIWSHLDNTSLCNEYRVESCKISVILFGSMLPNLKGH